MLKHYKLDSLKFLISILFILALYSYIYFFISKEFYIYSFDFGQHYAEFIQVHDLLNQHGLISTLKVVLHTIQNEDYNLFSAFLLSPFSFISTARISYLFAIITFFYLPSYYIYLRIIGLFNKKLSILKYFLVTSLFFLLPTILVPILRNESSIDALIPILMIFYLFFKQIIKKSLNLKEFLFIAFLLILPPLLHRWYLPFSLSFILLGFIFSLFIFRPIYKTILYYFFLSIVSSGLFLLISQNLWKKFFLTNYSVLYHHYQITSNPFLSLNLTFSNIGYPIIIIFAISLYFLIKKPFLRSISLFLLSIFTLDIFLFLRIQNMNIHHYYLIITPLLLIISLWISSTEFIKPIYLLVLFLIICNFIYPSVLNTSPWYYPQTNSVLNIISDLSIIKPKSVYVISFDNWFNASSLKYYTCYFNQKYSSLCPSIANVSYYASDGFYNSFIKSDYFLLNYQTLDKDTDPALKNLSLFIINHPSYYQIQQKYFPPNSKMIALYEQIKTPPKQDFDNLIKSITP